MLRFNFCCIPSEADSFKAKYLNDLWLFDTQEHKWKEIVFQVNQPSPS